MFHSYSENIDLKDTGIECIRGVLSSFIKKKKKIAILKSPICY